MNWTKLKDISYKLGLLICELIMNVLTVAIAILLLIKILIVIVDNKEELAGIIEIIPTDNEMIMASGWEYTYWDYVHIGWEYTKWGITKTGKAIVYTSTTVIQGIAMVTTGLVGLALVTQTILHPIESLTAALDFTKSIFTTVLTGLHVIELPQEGAAAVVASPTMVVLSIISVGVAAIGVALAHKVFERFFSHYEPTQIPIPETKSIPFDLINNKYEFIELTTVKYLLVAIVFILGAMLFIQIVPLIRNEINIYNDNNPSYSSKILIEDK